MKNIQKRLNLILILLFVILIHDQSSAQINPFYFSIKGKLVDSVSQPAAWATINLRNQTNEIIKSSVSDSIGLFVLNQIPKGVYTFQVIHLGYLSKTITLQLEDTLVEYIDVGVLRIEANSVELKEVEVRFLKPLVKQEVDRLVYDVQADPDSKGNSVLEIMRKVPFVSLDAEQNVLLKNSASFKIFINGRPSGMVEHNPREVLRSMPASTIEKIEVITNPPAKYDAEGFAGIINIITNTRLSDGYNGTVNVNETYPLGGPGMGGSFNFKAKKLMASVFMGASISKIPATDNFIFRNTEGSNPTTLAQAGNRKSDGETGYFGVDLSYEINNVQLISAQVNMSGNRSKELEFMQSFLRGNGGLLQGYHLRNDYISHGGNIDASLNYQLGFMAKKGRVFTLSYRYANYNSENNSSLNFSQITNYPYSDFRQENRVGSDEFTLQVDYIDKFGKWELESGLKGIRRENSSSFDDVYSSTLRNDFVLSQEVYAAYTSMAYKEKNWGLKGGLRAENTLVNGDVSHDYLNIVPSLSLGFQLKKGNNLNVGFSQRLRRAGINRLNPFIDRSNPNSEFSGNPNLNASSINNLILGYNRDGKLSVNIGLEYSFFNNLDLRIFTYDAVTGIGRSTYENAGEGTALTGDLYLNYRVTKDLNFNFNGNLIYLNVGSKGDVIPVTEGVYHKFIVSGSYRPLLSWRLVANINVNGKSPASKSFQTIAKGQINTGFSSSHELIKGKLDFTATLNNPFSKFRIQENNTSGLDFNERSDSWSYLRVYKVSLNYNFGRLKDKVKKTKRGIKNDDVSN